MCNMVVMKCLLRQKRMETKDAFSKQEELKKKKKKARFWKVMKVKTRKGTGRRGCNGIAANKKTLHV